MGTNYEIRLPIDIDKEYFPDLKRRMDIPGGQSEIGKLSIENLLNFQEIDLSKKPLASIQEEADGHIITSIIKKFDLIGGESEETLWNRFNDNSLKNCKELIMEKNTFICVNFENIVEQINESQLFRFIGRWELNYPGGYLILFNIKTDLLFRLLEVNKLYLGHNVSLPYWNMDTATLVYSYEETLNGKLYLADALGGETRSDYLYINKLIANNNYNALSLSPFDNWEKEKINASKGDVYLNRINLFFEATTLFPFDLLIKDKTGLTLFEHNSTTLLKNELKQIR
ncbi:MAG: hypothetical protein HGJ91_11500 [Desulfobacula sp.]|nr:hypothetical protein [Desulfobacula sp.]